MARLQPNIKVMKMTGLAIAFTYFGAFAFADSWGMTIDEVISTHPFYFYGAMACFVTLFLQGEIHDQKEKIALQKKSEESIVSSQANIETSSSTKKSKQKKKSTKKKSTKKK
jgi:hypothetical protein